MRSYWLEDTTLQSLKTVRGEAGSLLDGAEAREIFGKCCQHVSNISFIRERGPKTEGAGVQGLQTDLEGYLLVWGVAGFVREHEILVFVSLSNMGVP